MHGLKWPIKSARIVYIACACARYVAGHLPSALLQEAYTEFPKHHWGNFLGPCYYKKGTPMPGPPGIIGNARI